jgi:hypothetical protein
MKAWQRATGIILLVVAAVVIQQSVYVLRIFDGRQPGSGFMPFGLGVALAVLAVVLVLTNLGSDAVKKRFWTPGAWFRPLLALLVMAAFTAGFNTLGAVASVVVLVAVWLLVLERKPILVALVTGALTGGIVYVLFEVALQAPFPRGTLFGG